MADCQVVELEPQPAAVVAGKARVEELPAFFGRAFAAVVAAVEAQGVALAGAPFGYYPSSPTELVEVVAGFPTARPIEPAGDVTPFELPGGRAVTALHVGPYDTLASTYGEAMAWLAGQGLQPAGPMWESYLSDPAAEPDPATWRTRVVLPVA